MIAAKAIYKMSDHLSILIVEDQDTDIELLTLWLKRSSLLYTLQRARDEQELAAALRDEPDLVISDYHLTVGFSGVDVIRAIRAAGMDCPVIIVSGVLGDERATEIMRAGAADFLLKDRLARLEGAIVRAVTQRNLEREKRQAARELERERALFKALVENVAEVISIINRSGEFVYRSPATERMFGYMPAEYVGKSAFDFVHPDDLNISGGLFRRLIEVPGKVIKVYMRMKVKPGHRIEDWLRVEILGQNLLHDPYIDGIVAWTREVEQD